MSSHRDTEAQRLNEISKKIIACAIEVHRHLGPGLREIGYERAMAIEFRNSAVKFQQQVLIPAEYKGHPIGEYRIDFVVEDAVVVEVKSVERYEPLFEAQILAYLRVTRKKLGLLLNFNTRLLNEGVRRFIL